MRGCFRLMDEKVVTEETGVPCKGRDAKAPGKRKLEEQTGGVPVKFKSYQIGEGKPEQHLEDDATLQRGAILTKMDYSTESQFFKLLIPLYKPKLQSTVSKLVARFFASPVTEDNCKGGQLAVKLANDHRLAERMAQVLTDVGYVQQSVENFATELDGNYKDRNCAQHVNVNEELRTELKELHDAGVHELLADAMPAAALVVRHFDKFLALLP